MNALLSRLFIHATKWGIYKEKSSQLKTKMCPFLLHIAVSFVLYWWEVNWGPFSRSPILKVMHIVLAKVLRLKSFLIQPSLSLKELLKKRWQSGKGMDFIWATAFQPTLSTIFNYQKFFYIHNVHIGSPSLLSVFHGTRHSNATTCTIV